MRVAPKSSKLNHCDIGSTVTTADGSARRAPPSSEEACRSETNRSNPRPKKHRVSDKRYPLVMTNIAIENGHL